MKKENLKMYEKPKVEVVEIHLNECIAGSGAVQVSKTHFERHNFGTGEDDGSPWGHHWVNL